MNITSPIPMVAMAAVLPELDVKRRHLDPREYTFRRAADSEIESLVSQPCVVKENGKIQIVYLHLKDFGVDLAPLVERLKQMRFDTSTRTSGLDTTSRVFGYEPRKTLRKDFCGATSLAVEDPLSHSALCDAARVCEGLYRHYNPSLYERHREVVANKVLAEYHLRNTVFTSGIANKNNPLPYHFDRGNFASVWSAMLVFKGPGLEGGYLNCPQYGLAFALPDHSLFMFDGQGLLHGVTPMLVPPESYRFSVVYYSLRQMWRCETPAGELERIKKVKTGRERRRGGLQG